ncbi:SanA/YdcF family protein [Thaumasiovibrio subtropicus]|uniref:SanA/YdcF family protein n=1 Tax=Thaumasiovibrio subtropicus TaxID=1891207 RepID=UPI000B364720|nr:ElyC/SanA/YdcF family protein [Thaumasiovibrio subtropicus]
MRKAFLTLISLLVLCAFSLVAIDQWISFRYRNDIYNDVQLIPERRVGIVLGTSKYIGKTLNWFYQHRIDSALKLYDAEKVSVLLLSGDNAHRSYNEPWTMKRDFMRAGVPDENIVLDYAGFRTLDSIVRANKIFEANDLVVITQRFHCERALFLAEHNNIDAICFAAPMPGGLSGWKIRGREVLARFNAVVDVYLLNKQPKFLGPPHPIEPDAAPVLAHAKAESSSAVNTISSASATSSSAASTVNEAASSAATTVTEAN